MSDMTNPKDLAGQAKPQIHLLPAEGVLAGARVMMLGAAKYGPYNWREKHVKLSVYLSAMQRHILAYQDGQSTDPESGQSHLAHVIANCAIILDASKYGCLIDDMPSRGLSKKNGTGTV